MKLFFLSLCAVFAGASHWDNNSCRGKKALALRSLSLDALQTVTPECFASLEHISRTNLATVMPDLDVYILAHYNGLFTCATAQAISGDQFAHYGEELTGLIGENLSLEFFEPATVARISSRCLEGTLSSHNKHRNLLHLSLKAPEILRYALSNVDICCNLVLSDFEPLSIDFLGHIEPKCFAVLKDVSQLDLSPWLSKLPDNIFSNYDGFLSLETVAALTPRHILHFASDIRGKKVCQFLNLSTANPEVIKNLHNRCLLGALTGSFKHNQLSIFEAISQESLVYLMSNPRDICRSLFLSIMLAMPMAYREFWDSKCIAAMSDIETTHFGARLNELPDTIFEHYNGNFHPLDLPIVAPEKIAHFASKVDQQKCAKLQLSHLSEAALIKITPDCLVGYIEAGGSLDQKAWEILAETEIITEDTFCTLIEFQHFHTQQGSVLHSDRNWEAWYSKKVDKVLPDLFREHNPELFMENISKHPVAVLWLLHALKFRHLNDHGMIRLVTELIDLYPGEAQETISMQLAQSTTWVFRSLATTFIKTFSDAKTQLLTVPQPSSEPITIPLSMVNGVFDFKASYNYVVQESENLLQRPVRWPSNGHMSQDSLMRLWVDQMLDYIIEFKLLIVSSEGIAYFPLFADPSVGTFLGVVYAKALALGIKPPVSILPAIDFVLKPEFRFLYMNNFGEFYQALQQGKSLEDLDLLLKSYQFVEPEDMETWHPILRPLTENLPKALSDRSPTKVYTEESLRTDYLQRFIVCCCARHDEFIWAFTIAFATLFDLEAYLVLPRRTLAHELFGKTIFEPEKILAVTILLAPIADAQVPSLSDTNQNISFPDAFASIIHALNEKQRSRLVAVMTGSKYTILQSDRLYVSSWNTVFGLSPDFAFGPNQFITQSDYMEIFQRALDYQQTVLKGPKKEVSEIPQDQSFFASHMLSGSGTLRVCVQSSQGLLLSLMHLLNNNPVHMCANFEQ